MILYQSSVEHDLILEAWYHHLTTTGDLALLFPQPARRSLSQFLRAFQSPCECVFEMNDHGEVLRAAWFDPFDVGARCGLWIREDHRRSVEAFNFTMAVLKGGLLTYKVLFNITFQADLLEPHRRLGYTVLTELPDVLEGQSAWLLLLTPVAFEGSPAHERWLSTLRRHQQSAQPEPVH